MPRIMRRLRDFRRSQLARSTFHPRVSAVACNPNPIYPSPVFQPEENLNEAVDSESDEVLELDTFLRRQSFRDNRKTPLFSHLEESTLWVHDCGLYDTATSRWKGIDDDVSLECLVSRFRRIIDAYQDKHCNDRDMVYSTESYDRPPGDHLFKSLPFLAVCATRLSFSTPNGDCHMDWEAPFHLSAIDVAFEDNIWETHESIQMGIYARKYLSEQPSRRSFTCLLLTEVNVRVYCFDSNGLLYYDATNIHERPVDFICAINRVSQTSIEREFDHTTHRHNGTVYLYDRNLCPYPFKVVRGAPFYTSQDLMGRRTVCWKLIGRAGRRYFLKNSSAFWDEENGMLLEFQVLSMARGIPGICRLIDHYESSIPCPFKTLRPGFFQPFESPVLYNMRCSLVTEYYERSILDFDHRLDLLYILQDAIIAHEKLWLTEIWHDDIRPENIRIANPGFDHDSWAVLIGFARAKIVDPTDGTKFEWGDERKNNVKFKSRLRPLRYIPHFGYLHDLESFLLVLCYVCAAVRKPHAHARPNPTVQRNMAGWADISVASDLKDAFLTQVHLPGRVKPYFGQVFVDLISAWKAWLDAAFLDAPSHGFWRVVQTREHYGDVLDMIDKAIARVKEEEGHEEKEEEEEEERPTFVQPFLFRKLRRL